MKPEVISDYRSQIGEGPIWHPMEKRIYWVDIPEGKVLRYNEKMKNMKYVMKEMRRSMA